MERSFKPKKEISAEDHNDSSYQQGSARIYPSWRTLTMTRQNCSCVLTSLSSLITFTSNWNAAVRLSCNVIFVFPLCMSCCLWLDSQAIEMLLCWLPCNIIFVLPSHMSYCCWLHSQAIEMLLCWLSCHVIFVFPLCMFHGLWLDSQAIEMLLCWLPCNVIFVLPSHMSYCCWLDSQAIKMLLCFYVCSIISD